MTGQTSAERATRDASSGGRADVVAGLLAAGLGVAVLLHVATFPRLPDGQPGPALFPGIIGGLFVVFGLALALSAVLRGRRAVEPRETGHETAPAATGPGRLNGLSVLGFVLAYLLLVEALGFVLTMGGLLFLLTWRLSGRALLAGASAGVTTAVIVVVFQRVLLVPLPTGLLG